MILKLVGAVAAALQERLGIRIGRDYPEPLAESELPYGRMMQMDRIKQQRTELKQARKKAAGGQGRKGRQHTRSDGNVSKGTAAAVEGGGTASDKYRYHEDERKRPVGNKRVEDIRK